MSYMAKLDSARSAAAEEFDDFCDSFGPVTDLFAVAPAPAVQPEWLPRVVADYAFEHAELIGVQPSIIAIPCLVACAAAIHDDVRIQPKQHDTSWTESARLWCAIVGGPSIKKSPAIRRATAPLRKINAKLAAASDASDGEYQANLSVWQDVKRAAKKTCEPCPPAPDKPVYRRLVVEDATTEALGDILADNPGGVLTIRDELSGWFGSMDAYSGGSAGGKDRAAWLELYNGGGRQIDRVMRGRITIPNWSSCIIGGIQPDAMRKLAAKMSEDGLMQRFMLVVGHPCHEPEADRPIDARIHAAYSDAVEALHTLCASGEPVRLTPEANAIRVALSRDMAQLAAHETLPAGLRYALGKYDGLFPRLLLTYHCLECIAAGKYPPDALVRPETAARVDGLMRRFLLPHAVNYYHDVMGEATGLEHLRWIAGHVLSKSLFELRPRDITIAYRQWRAIDDRERNRLLQALADAGWIKPDGDYSPWRGTVGRWLVNPRAHEQHLARADDEKKSRAAVRALIR